jgi:hypothetical protein
LEAKINLVLQLLPLSVPLQLVALLVDSVDLVPRQPRREQTLQEVDLVVLG